MSSPDGETVIPFQLAFTRHAEFDLADALSFLRSSPGGVGAAIRFNDLCDAILDELCHSVANEIATTRRLSAKMQEAASVYFARPVYRMEIHTTKTRARRSSAGLWHLFYTIEDRNKDGIADTVTVVAIQHSAAAPFAVSTGALEDQDEQQ